MATTIVASKVYHTKTLNVSVQANCTNLFAQNAYISTIYADRITPNGSTLTIGTSATQYVSLIANNINFGMNDSTTLSIPGDRILLSTTNVVTDAPLLYVTIVNSMSDTGIQVLSSRTLNAYVHYTSTQKWELSSSGGGLVVSNVMNPSVALSTVSARFQNLSIPNVIISNRTDVGIVSATNISTTTISSQNMNVSNVTGTIVTLSGVSALNYNLSNNILNVSTINISGSLYTITGTTTVSCLSVLNILSSNNLYVGTSAETNVLYASTLATNSLSCFTLSVDTLSGRAQMNLLSELSCATLHVSSTVTSPIVVSMLSVTNLSVTNGISTVFTGTGTNINVSGLLTISGNAFVISNLSQPTVTCSTLNLLDCNLYCKTATLSNLLTTDLCVTNSLTIVQNVSAEYLSTTTNFIVSGSLITPNEMRGNNISIIDTLVCSGNALYTNVSVLSYMNIVGNLSIGSYNTTTLTGLTTLTVSTASVVQTTNISTLQFVYGGNTYNSFKMDYGSSAFVSGNMNVTFTTGYFSSAPNVMVTVLDSTNTACEAHIQTVSSGGFSVGGTYNYDTALDTNTFYWIAMGS